MKPLANPSFETLEECLEACQDNPVLVEREGAPTAVIISLEAYEYFLELETGIMQLLGEMEDEVTKLSKPEKASAKKKPVAKKTAKKIVKKTPAKKVVAKKKAPMKKKVVKKTAKKSRK